MPFVRGFLRVGRRHRPGGGGEVDPGYGIEEGGSIDNELPGLGGDDDLEIGGGPIIPAPPPGIWPPLTPEAPWRPIDPGWGQGRPLPPVVGGGPARPPVHPGQPLPPDPGHPAQPLPPGEGEVEPPMVLPPGSIWPPLPPGVSGKYLALVLIGGMPGGPKYRYVVIDAGLRPDNSLPGRPGRPDNTLPPTAEPRR